jgi:hypothetical protein
LAIAAIGYPIGRFEPNLYAESAPADEEGHSVAARPDRSALRALADHASHHPRAGTPDTADSAASPDDLRPRPREPQADDARHAAAS